MSKKMVRLSVSGEPTDKLIKMIKKKFDSIKIARIVRERKRFTKNSVKRKIKKAAGTFRHKLREKEIC